MCIPSISSFTTCVPASSIPTNPSSAHFHASGPRLTRNSETICWLPGGRKLVKSEIRSNRLVPAPIGLVARATAMSKVGKNARNRLNAMACEIMLQRGKTRPNMLSARFETAADAIIFRHYTCGADFPNSLSRSPGCATSLAAFQLQVAAGSSIFANPNPNTGHWVGEQLQVDSDQTLLHQ